MADKPTTLPEWASTEETDPVSGQLNRVEPPSERKSSGWTRREIPPRQWWNWLLWRIWQWLKWVNAGTHQATVSTIMERDANGRSKVEQPSDNKDAANKIYVDGEIDKLSLSEDRTVNIPTDYDDLQSAFDGESYWRPNGYTITVNIESGYEIDSGLLIAGGDYSHFVITADDQTVLVDTVNYSGVRYQGALLEANWADIANEDNLFIFVNCVSPVIACRIDMQGVTGNGLTLANSRVQIAAFDDQGEPTADSYGVLNAGGTNLLSVSSGYIFARATVWNGAGERGVRLTASTIAEMQWATADDCTVSGFFASRGSVLHAFRCSARNAGQYGVQVHRSFAAIDGADCRNAGTYGIRAINASVVNAGLASGIGGDIATNVSGSGEGAHVTDASTLNIEGGANVDGCGVGINARRGASINASGVVATNCTNEAVLAFEGSHVNFSGGDATGSNGGTNNVQVLDGSTIAANGATNAALNITANTVTGNGIIFQ